MQCLKKLTRRRVRVLAGRLTASLRAILMHGGTEVPRGRGASRGRRERNTPLPRSLRACSPSGLRRQWGSSTGNYPGNSADRVSPVDFGRERARFRERFGTGKVGLRSRSLPLLRAVGDRDRMEWQMKSDTALSRGRRRRWCARQRTGGTCNRLHPWLMSKFRLPTRLDSVAPVTRRSLARSSARTLARFTRNTLDRIQPARAGFEL